MAKQKRTHAEANKERQQKLAELPKATAIKVPPEKPSEAMPDVSAYFALLGFQCRDRVTGFTGVIASLSFDLYGCVQAAISPPIDKDGKYAEGRYFDVNRIEVTSKERVMPIPSFEPRPELHEYGPADRPAFNK